MTHLCLHFCDSQCIIYTALGKKINCRRFQVGNYVICVLPTDAFWIPILKLSECSALWDAKHTLYNTLYLCWFSHESYVTSCKTKVHFGNCTRSRDREKYRAKLLDCLISWKIKKFIHIHMPWRWMKYLMFLTSDEKWIWKFPKWYT